MGAAFRVEVFDDWAGIAADWATQSSHGFATPFQQPLWVEAWFATIGRAQAIRPLLVKVMEGDDPDPVLLLPLILSQRGRLKVIEAADLGVTDYNAPVLGPGPVLKSPAAAALWRAVLRALPPSDLVELTKVPSEIAGRPNPLVMLRHVDRSPLHGNLLTISGSWAGYHDGFERTFRKEIERSWRVFERHPDARFEMIVDQASADETMSALERQQALRMAGLGNAYLLDRPGYGDFYRQLVRGGLSDGSVRLAALKADGEIAAALLGITGSATFSMVRLSTGDARWRNCSPGRLIIYKMMESLHEQGFRQFDFTIGDYPYKRRMGVAATPLFNLIQARSAAGWLVALMTRLRFALQRSDTWRRLRGRPPAKGIAT